MNTAREFTKLEKQALADRAMKALDGLNSALRDCHEAGMNPQLSTSGMLSDGKKPTQIEMALHEVICWLPLQSKIEPKKDG